MEKSVFIGIRVAAKDKRGAFGMVRVRRAVSASWDNTLKVWDLETGMLIATFTCDAGVVSCAFASSQRIEASDAGGRVLFLALEGIASDTGWGTR